MVFFFFFLCSGALYLENNGENLPIRRGRGLVRFCDFQRKIVKLLQTRCSFFDRVGTGQFAMTERRQYNYSLENRSGIFIGRGLGI